MASVARSVKGLDLVQRMFQTTLNRGGFESFLSKMKITSAENGTLTAVMTVDKEHANLCGTIHGAAATLLVDSLSNLTLATFTGTPYIGFSTNLNMTFIDEAPVGEEIEIISSLDRIGSKQAFLSVDIFNKRTGDLIAKGSHTKCISLNKSDCSIQG